GAPIMTLLFSRFGKRSGLMALMAIFTLGNLLSALSPDYYTLLASRLVTSLNHGAFFGLGAVVAAGTPPMLAMVRPMNMVATALACFSLGTTLAATTAP
ncbi:MFS transporter, partial [Pseudomonas putida]|nr:MFS transporter [Pseudomonas putida]